MEVLDEVEAPQCLGGRIAERSQVVQKEHHGARWPQLADLAKSPKQSLVDENVLEV
jgi:hypothetical protein